MMSSILCLKGAWQTEIYLCAPLWLIHKLTDAKVFAHQKFGNIPFTTQLSLSKMASKRHDFDEIVIY